MRNSSWTPDLRPAPVVDRHKNAVAAFEVWDEWRFTPAEIIEGSDGVFVAVDNWGRSKVWSRAGIAHLSGVPRSRRHGHLRQGIPRPPAGPRSRGVVGG